MKITTVVTYPAFLDAPAKAVRQAVSRGLLAAARLWHRKYMPMHFREGASQRYGYQRRTVKYMIRKRRQKGHSRPLVWTGEMRRMLTRERQEKALKNRAAASIKMRGPFYLRREGQAAFRGQPDMNAEIKTTAATERQKLAERTHRDATAELNRAMKTRRTRRVG